MAPDYGGEAKANERRNDSIETMDTGTYNHVNSIGPPKWPLRFLRFFVKKEYLEEIEGDMEEIFMENLERFSPRKAKRIYTWEMVKLLRPVLIKNLEFLQHLNQHAMFKNYFKVSIRGLMKNPLNSFINVFGLAVAIGICVFAYGFARYTLKIDQFHEHKHEVYLVTFLADRDGTLRQHGKTPRPLGEMLRQDFAHIKKVCRIEDRNVVMRFEDKVFHERVRFTDAEFLDMFTFPLKWGTTNSLKDANSIILSEAMSIKYFGDENPIGQSIQMIFDKDRSKAFKVTGVAKEFPKSRTISFDFLINFENLRTSYPNYDFHDWNAFVNATLIQVDNPGDILTIEKGMEKYKTIQNKAAEKDWAISDFAFEPLATLNERSEYIQDDISRSSKTHYISIMFMAGIAFFMLVLACFNYINIAIVTAAKRLKEIGVRKSIGATRRAVIIQFLAENIVLTFFALVIGVLVGYAFFIRGFEQLWNFDMDFSLYDRNLWIFLPVVLLITSIASGIYPALYISRFQVVNILKGSVMFGRKNPLTKVFLSFQLIMAYVFITTSIMFTQNTSYLSERPWGYNNRETLYANVPEEGGYEKLRDLMAQDPDVLSISGSTHHVGKSHAVIVLHFPDREYEVDQLSVDAKYFETMEIPLKEGRVFKDYEGSDKQAVVTNEALVKKMAWDNPIGKVFKIDSIQCEVIGVVNDFHNYSFDNEVRPMVFNIAEQKDFRYLSMKVTSGTELKVHKSLQENWAKLFPEIPFEGGHQEDVWGNYYQEIAIYDLVWKVFASIAIALAVLGLYGLVKLNVEGRTKEFSIRKVLGAGLENIASSITDQYFILFALALVIGAPLGYLFATWLIEFAYTYHMPITFSGAIIAVVIMSFVLLITVSTQISKVIKSNPVNGLKTE
jgi:putative ABC transport system permease protein